MPFSCKGKCDSMKNTRKISKITGNLPRCIECEFAYKQDLGQIRCGCCKNQLRRVKK